MRGDVGICHNRSASTNRNCEEALVVEECDNKLNYAEKDHEVRLKKLKEEQIKCVDLYKAFGHETYRARHKVDRFINACNEMEQCLRKFF